MTSSAEPAPDGSERGVALLLAVAAVVAAVITLVAVRSSSDASSSWQSALRQEVARGAAAGLSVLALAGVLVGLASVLGASRSGRVTLLVASLATGAAAVILVMVVW